MARTVVATQSLGDGCTRPRQRLHLLGHDAQAQLGDIVFVELPKAADEPEVTKDEPFAVVESVKAASDIYAPVSGEVIEVNEALESSPELANSEPYGEGWFFRMRAENIEELDALLDAEGYGHSLDEE